MSENSESEVEVDPYEQIVGLNLIALQRQVERRSLFPVTNMNLARLTSTDP